ncbi:MAG: bifunctional ornithine acetyltransferase/N-acetylglutamate synthase, partial [Melioribacteraceae bacterium]|nr:bifunctional ornithine acetyltransferase/N-acetylglutamate synthase [Melioribacteraceae bacterium]
MLRKLIVEDSSRIEHIEEGSITSAQGFKASGINCGLKKLKKDLALIYSESPAVAAGTFTTNKAAAAPVVISKNIINNSEPVKAILINSANANACTGLEGHLDALEIQSKCAEELNIAPTELLLSSTGVI